MVDSNKLMLVNKHVQSSISMVTRLNNNACINIYIYNKLSTIEKIHGVDFIHFTTLSIKQIWLPLPIAPPPYYLWLINHVGKYKSLLKSMSLFKILIMG